MDKKEIRKILLDKRDKYSDSERNKWDKLIFEKFINSKYYKKAVKIFIFVSFRSEVDTHDIINRAIMDGKTICVPKVISKEKGMRAYRVNGMNDMEKGYYGILEPCQCCEEILVKDIDLVVMPGAAFDHQGGRIGYGGGFYDRFLLQVNSGVKKVALAYKFQVLESVPMEDNDIKVDDIITD